MKTEAEYWETILALHEERIRLLELECKRYRILLENCRKAALEEINRDP